jgi:hypothetical protein
MTDMAEVTYWPRSRGGDVAQQKDTEVLSGTGAYIYGFGLALSKIYGLCV